MLLYIETKPFMYMGRGRMAPRGRPGLQASESDLGASSWEEKAGNPRPEGLTHPESRTESDRTAVAMAAGRSEAGPQGDLPRVAPGEEPLGAAVDQAGAFPSSRLRDNHTTLPPTPLPGLCP